MSICVSQRRPKLKKLEEHDRRFDAVDRRFGEVMTGMDKIVGELEKAREDRAFAFAKDREQDRRLDRIEIRLG